MKCPKCFEEMEREDGVEIKSEGNSTYEIPYADYFCDNCNEYWQWVRGVTGLRNTTDNSLFYSNYLKWEI